MGVVPVMGIPLPLISYGGSSLLGFSILIFVAIALDASPIKRQKYEEIYNEETGEYEENDEQEDLLFIQTDNHDDLKYKFDLKQNRGVFLDEDWRDFRYS